MSRVSGDGNTICPFVFHKIRQRGHLLRSCWRGLLPCDRGRPPADPGKRTRLLSVQIFPREAKPSRQDSHCCFKECGRSKSRKRGNDDRLGTTRESPRWRRAHGIGPRRPAKLPWL